MSGAPAAFAFLFSRTLHNRLAAQVRRVRSPRYLLAVAVAVGYFVFLLYRPAQDVVGSAPSLPGTIRPDVPRDLALLSACALALLAAKWWLIGSANTALAFSAPEVQFLFPAPIPRRDLILYKLWRMQIGLVVSAIVITVFVRRAGAPLPPALRIVSLWILFCTLSLHQIVAALARAGAAQRGRGLWRNAVPLVVAGGATLVLLAAAVRAWPGMPSIETYPSVLTRLGEEMRSPVPAAVLWPFRLVLAPTYARTPADWARALWPALVVLLLHTVWVLRADSVFEDAAVRASALRAQRLAATRGRAAGAAYPTPSMVGRISGSMAAIRPDRSPPGGGGAAGGAQPSSPSMRVVLPLAPIGNPAVAIVWKNTLALVRGLRLRTAIIVALTLAGVVIALHEAGLLGDTALGNGATFLGVLGLTAAAFMVVMGPLTVRNDLRQDLLHLDTLRTFPMRGSTLVLAEIASSALALTVVQWLLVAAADALLSWGAPGAGAPSDPGPLLDLSASTRAVAVVMGLGTLPVLNATSFFVQNTAALLFPAWIRLGGTGMGGLEVIGQRILAVGASLGGVSVMLAGPVVAGVVVFVLWQRDGPLAAGPVAAGGAAAIAVVAAELYVGIRWLGRRFERTDASALPPH